MEEKFDFYVAGFDIADPNIKGKWEHSYRVVEKASMIAEHLNLNEEDTYLAKTIAFLHDLGRFEQWTKYKTFNDLKSIDHGDYACELLFQKGMIEKFKIEPKYYGIIKKAIQNHNKVKIEEGLTEQELLQAKIIRDADKLDIFYILACLDWVKYPYSEEPISKNVKETFMSHHLIYTKDIQNTNDEVIRSLGFVFDFNYDVCLEYIIQNHYLEEFQKNVNHDELFNPYFEELKQYIEKRN